MKNLFQNIIFNNKSFIVMRDDLFHPILSGNKARKLAFITDNIQKYQHIKKIVSFGGNQSNFMYSLSQLAKMNNWEFDYWIKPLPKFLKQTQKGNLKLSLDNNMKLCETNEIIDSFFLKEKYPSNKVLIFDQGGRQQEAEIGIKQCALTIKNYVKENNINNFSVFVPSGTGTTALFLEKFLPNKVYTTACIGDSNYLKKQMLSILNSQKLPKILSLGVKNNLGQLDINKLNIYKELLKQTKIEFDLLYDPIGWKTLLKNYNYIQKPIIYIHCGGITGNETMLARYNRIYT